MFAANQRIFSNFVRLSCSRVSEAMLTREEQAGKDAHILTLMTEKTYNTYKIL